jgi:flagellar motor switch protein FliG
MPYSRSERIRRAAILVASLDESLAEALLADLPPSEAARVLAEAERLESIDPEEQADVLAEFRRVSRGGRSSGGGVEFAISSAASELPTAASTDNAANSADEATSADEPLSEGDATAMAELLSGEHPQIVAAALSRLGDEQCAAVFAALPSELQAEALERLGSLAPVDEDALSDIESQLQHHLQQRRDHQARAAAGAELVRRILARTPATQRIYLLERMSAKNALPASVEAPVVSASPRAQRAVAVDRVAQQAINLAAAVRRTQNPQLHEPLILADRTEALELLSDEALVTALRAASESTVLRALAASGESFLGRVTGMLPRRQARQLRRMMRELGPTRLADLHRAQHELLRLAHEHAAVKAA